jgi:hypothetical protein
MANALDSILTESLRKFANAWAVDNRDLGGSARQDFTIQKSNPPTLFVSDHMADDQYAVETALKTHWDKSAKLFARKVDGGWLFAFDTKQLGGTASDLIWV